MAKADLAVVYYLEGQIDIREGHYARAEALYNSAIEADPTKGLLFLSRAECLRHTSSSKLISEQEKQEKLRQLDSDLKEAIRLDPTLKDKAESIRKLVMGND